MRCATLNGRGEPWPSLLVVDDEPRIRTVLNRSLSAQGHTVYEAADGQAALDQLDSRDMDLVLLDLAMPRRGGLDVLSVLKERESSPPVIVLTAVTEISARIQALDRGAVDVVAKPFSTMELSARIRRHLHQETSVPAGEQRYLEAGGVQLDLHRRRAVTAQGPVSLTGREFALLAHLMRRSNDVCSREELLHDIWDLDFDPGSNVVDVCVGRLRSKLQPTPRSRRCAVLATASTTSESPGPLAGRTGASLFDRRHLLAVWTVWAMACVIVMFLRPGQETIPYHLGWAGFALAFGLGTWSRWQLVTALAWYTLATGAALERSWLLGNIGWDETTEIPLMFLLAMLMVWHVRRRQAALAHVTRLAEREVQACLDREQLMRLTSHELRTPLTIARGYIELLQTRATELDNQQDLSVVGDELERLSRVSDRLIRMILLQDDTTSEMVDIDQVMAQAVERWQVVADRRWVLDARAGRVVGSPERLRTGLDTLVENAIRYTSVGDTIRLVGSRQLDHVVVGVFDTGVGLTDNQIIGHQR